MKKILLTLLILSSIFVLTSCVEEIGPIIKADYRVIELDYGFDNYLNNTTYKSDDIIIKQRNIVIIEVDKNGKTIIEDNFIPDSLIISEVKKYIIPDPTDKEKPMTTEQNFRYSGTVNMNKNIIILAKYDKQLNYEKYRDIRNKFYLAYNEVHNEFSVSKFGKSLAELLQSGNEEDIEKWREVRQIFEIRYTETVDKNNYR